MPNAEHRITVSRTARYFTNTPPEGRIEQIWFVCHGYGQLAERFLRDFAQLSDGRTLIVAPEALSRAYIRGTDGHVGASWMTREDRLSEIDDYVRYLDAVHDEVRERIAPSEPGITVLGFSQGTATAGRWLGLGRIRADRAILSGGLLPPDLPEEAWQRLAPIPITYVIGSEDDLVDRAALARQRDELARRGVAERVVAFNGGHRIDTPTLLAL